MHIAGLLITCLGPCKQPNACRHASSLAFFENVMLQQQRMHFTKWAARTQKIQTGCWGQQTGPFKSDEQGCGGKKQTCQVEIRDFEFLKILVAKRNVGYKSVTAAHMYFFPTKIFSPAPHCPHQWPCKRAGAHLGCMGLPRF